MSHIRGRFHKEANKLVTGYIASIPFDWRLYRHDIAGSIAHAKMLAKQGIISPKEAEAIIGGLTAIREEIEQGKFQFKPELEDIHMNIEARLIDKVGEVGRELHTARSRNGQVALDLRLFTREAVAETLVRLREYKGFSPLFGEDVYSITIESSIAARDVTGGTAPKQVAWALANAKKLLGEAKS
jgi:argininosuccinate lyase